MRSRARTERLVHAYVAAVLALGVIAFGFSYSIAPFGQPSGGPSGPVGLGAFLLIAFGLQVAEHRLTVGTATGSIAFIIYMACALVFGPTWCALIVSVTVTAAQLISRKAPIKIAFNARYMIDVLDVIDTAQVSLETRDTSSPGVLRPVGGGDFVHIIMPMHIAQ